MKNNIVKYSTVFIGLILFANISFAQKQQPYEMMIDGVKVIVQPSGNEIVEIQTIIKGGVQNYSADKAGIESIAMTTLTECGTRRDDKNSFKNKLDKVSAQISGSSEMDFASFKMNCIKNDFDVVWPLYVDALTAPRFDGKEFDRIKQDAINGLRSQASQPDYAISQFARQVAFAGKNYAKSPEGVETTINKLTAAETKAYYTSLLTRSRMLIVVVGEIDRDVLEKNIKAMLASIPTGKPFILKKEMYSPTKNTFNAIKKDYATNYIQGVTGAPLPGSADYNPFTLAMQIFYDRNFLEIRTNNGLSYAPYSYFDNGLTPSANIGVSTTDPNKYIGVVDNLINRTKRQGFTPAEVNNMKTTYITLFYYRQETNSAQASSLASNEVLHNNWHRSLTLNDDLKKVTLQDVNNSFNKYVTNLTWVYQGDPAKANPQLFTSVKSKEKLPASKVKVEKKN